MPVPFAFGSATSAIPLSQLDANFNTTITLGNTAIQLGNTVTTLNNMTLANVTISSGNVTITNVTVTTANVTTVNATTVIATTANVTTGNVTNLISGNVALTGGAINGTTLGATTAASANVTTLTTSSTVTLNGGTAGGVAYLNGSKVLTTGSALTFDGTTLGVTGPVSSSRAGSENYLLTDSSSATRSSLQQAGNALYFNVNDNTATTGSFIWRNTNATSELMRLTSTGLGIGTTSPTQKLQVYGTAVATQISIDGTGRYKYFEAYASGTRRFYSGWDETSLAANLFTDGAHPITFGTNGSERARIDSSGNLLVQSTSSSVTSDVGHKIRPDAAAPFMGTVGSSTSGADVTYSLYSTGAAAYRFYVGYNGTISATTTTISAISDIRFKENVRDLDVGLEKIMALKPRLYDWKKGKGADIKNARGFIAQEFEQVFPDLIDEWKDPAPEGEEPYKAVRQDLIPVLVKALQEQQAIIEQLKADVAALKGA